MDFLRTFLVHWEALIEQRADDCGTLESKALLRSEGKRDKPSLYILYTVS